VEDSQYIIGLHGLTTGIDQSGQQWDNFVRHQLVLAVHQLHKDLDAFVLRPFIFVPNIRHGVGFRHYEFVANADDWRADGRDDVEVTMRSIAFEINHKTLSFMVHGDILDFQINFGMSIFFDPAVVNHFEEIGMMFSAAMFDRGIALKGKKHLDV